MANIREIADGGSNPNTPTVKQMRDSQNAGATGTGTNNETYADRMTQRNHGVGVGQEASDETFPVAANYKESGDTGLPWE